MGRRIHVLVVYASNNGSTRKIAECIASRLEHHGLSIDVARERELRTIGDHDAVVIGSAVCFGSWMKEARAFVRGNERTLAQRRCGYPAAGHSAPKSRTIMEGISWSFRGRRSSMSSKQP